jgi:hypothetical protein
VAVNCGEHQAPTAVARAKIAAPTLAAEGRAETFSAIASSFQTVSLLIAEKGQYAVLPEVMDRLLMLAEGPGIATDLAEPMTEVSNATADVLRQERGAMADEPGGMA